MPEDSGRRVRDLLPGQFSRMDEAVRRAINDDPGFSRNPLPSFFAGLVCEKAADFVCSALDCDAFELMAKAWTTARELDDAARQSRDKPDKRIPVFLGQHDAVCTSHPVVEVSVARMGRLTLRFTLELAAHFNEAGIILLDGRIVELGRCGASFTALLKYRDLALHEKKPLAKLATPGLKLPAPGLTLGLSGKVVAEDA
jgi:hypothetical protein